MDVRVGHKESWAPKNSCFWTMVLEKTLESPLDWKEINQSVLKEINPEYSLEGLMLKLKLQSFGHHLMWRAYSVEKTLMLGKIEPKSKKHVSFCSLPSHHESKYKLATGWWETHGSITFTTLASSQPAIRHVSGAILDQSALRQTASQPQTHE